MSNVEQWRGLRIILPGNNMKTHFWASESLFKIMSAVKKFKKVKNTNNKIQTTESKTKIAKYRHSEVSHASIDKYYNCR